VRGRAGGKAMTMMRLAAGGALMVLVTVALMGFKTSGPEELLLQSEAA